MSRLWGSGASLWGGLLGGCRHRRPLQNLPGLARGGSPTSPLFPPTQKLPAARLLEPSLAPCYSENQVLGPERILRGSGSVFTKVRLRSRLLGRTSVLLLCDNSIKEKQLILTLVNNTIAAVLRALPLVTRRMVWTILSPLSISVYRKRSPKD